MNQPEFFENHMLRITPLSPLHIGCDETYEPTSAVMVENALYALPDAEFLLDALDTRELEKLGQILSGEPDVTMLQRMQRFFDQHKTFLVPFATHAIPVCAGFAHYYEERIGKVMQQEGQQRGKREEGFVINRLTMDRTIFNPVDHTPYVPGGSLKGAIRTALLDRENDGKSLKHQKENNDALQKRLFDYQKFDHDPMRAVQLGDAQIEKRDSSENSQLPRTKLYFAVNRKREPVLDKQGKLRDSAAEQKNLNQRLECIPAWGQTFSAALNLYDWQSKTDQKFQFSLEEIAQSCNRFYGKVLENELQQLENPKLNWLDPEWTKWIRNWVETQQNQNKNGFLLRIGRHSGAEAVTLEGVRNIKIMEGRDPKTKKAKFSWQEAAKTVWLAAEELQDQRGLLPFGWVWVDVDPPEPTQLPAPWNPDEIAQIRNWVEKTTSEKAAFKKKLGEKQQLQQEQEEKQAAQEAEEKRLAQQEADRIANLSPLELRMEEIIQNSGDSAGIALLKALQTDEWDSADDRKQVAEEIKQMWEAEKRWIPEFSGSNKKKLKIQKQCLAVLEYL